MRRRRLLARAVPSPYADGADASFGDRCSARSVEPFDLVRLALLANALTAQPLVPRQVAGRLLEAALHLVDQSHVRSSSPRGMAANATGYLRAMARLEDYSFG